MSITPQYNPVVSAQDGKFLLWSVSPLFILFFYMLVE